VVILYELDVCSKFDLGRSNILQGYTYRKKNIPEKESTKLYTGVGINNINIMAIFIFWPL
jgi:hypothetical protein